jgi:hypothetical protein
MHVATIRIQMMHAASNLLTIAGKPILIVLGVISLTLTRLNPKSPIKSGC